MINGTAQESGVFQIASNTARRRIADLDATVDDDQFHKFVLQRTGDLFSIYFDDNPVAVFTEPGLPAGLLGLGAFNDRASFDDVCIQGHYSGEILLTASLPNVEAGLTDTVVIALKLSTELELGFAQMVVEFDSTVLKFIGVDSGADASGFSLITNADLPFEPIGSGVNDNVLVQLSGTSAISGQNQTVAILNFQAISMPDTATPLLFDKRPTHTSFSINSTDSVAYNSIEFENGSVKIKPKLGVLSGETRYLKIDSAAYGRPIAGATVTVHHYSGEASDTTDEVGRYHISQIVQGPIEIAINKTGEQRQAVTGVDAMYLLRHLAFLDMLTANQLLAGDVDQNGIVSGSDSLLLLRYLAFFSSSTGRCGEWFF